MRLSEVDPRSASISSPSHERKVAATCSRWVVHGLPQELVVTCGSLGKGGAGGFGTTTGLLVLAISGEALTGTPEEGGTELAAAEAAAR